MKNATSFGRQATTYAKGRPGYPPELYDWIAANSPNQETVWDAGTGSGQAAQDLAQYFEHVYATDISDAQIKAAASHEKVTYKIAAAEQSGLTENWADAVTVATAVHWFASSEFWAEVARVGKSGALFCAWTYQLPRSTEAVDRDFLTPLYELLDPYWAEGNRICMVGYSSENLNCPYPQIETPVFDAGAMWSVEQLVNFAKSWSAHFRAREDGKALALDALQTKFMRDYADQTIAVSLPLSVLAVRIK